MKRYIAGVVVGVLGFSSVAYMSSEHTPNIITGSSIEFCIKESGAAFVVGYGFKKKECKKDDRLITINKTGPVGPQGPQGIPGVAGPK